jgi:hypothetical protein
MRSFRGLKGLRTLVTATSGFVAGAVVESRFPFIEKLDLRLKHVTEDTNFPPVVKTVVKKQLDLPYLTDQVFETTDNMLTFMFPSEEVFRNQTSRVIDIVEAIKEHQAKGNLKRVKMFFTIVPPRETKRSSVDENVVEIMCYKGQRKQRISLNSSEVPLDTLDKFFEVRSAPVEDELKSCVIEHISGSEFEDKVLHVSSKEKPVFLQLYEKSCFLCFLMRPFLNSLATVLSSDPAIPFTVKRLDIEENDFPDQLPVVRGTPTFVLFQGNSVAPQRIEEFKPRDLVNRIVKDYEVKKETEKRLYELVDKMTLRFQMFSGLVMWNTESEKILDLISGSDVGHNPTIPFDLTNSEDKDKAIFNRLVSDFMSEDMLKVDTLDENLRSLSRELTQMEKHAIMMGQVIGEKVANLELGE